MHFFSSSRSCLGSAWLHNFCICIDIVSKVLPTCAHRLSLVLATLNNAVEADNVIIGALIGGESVRLLME